LNEVGAGLKEEKRGEERRCYRKYLHHVIIEERGFSGPPAAAAFFTSLTPLTIRSEYRLRHQALSTPSLESRDKGKEAAAIPEAPEISRTSPHRQEGNHEKNSAEASAAIRSS
jgi:hypothetical protein